MGFHAAQHRTTPKGAQPSPMQTLTRTLAIALLLGTLLLGGGAAMHPILSGDGTMELGMIGGMAIWRTMHLCMLAGTGLIVVGIWVRLVGAPAGAPATPAVIAALAIITVGMALDSLNTTFMAGPAWRMAAAFTAGDASIARQFELLHPVGLMAARFGNYLVALGAIVLGAAEWMTAGRPRWLAPCPSRRGCPAASAACRGWRSRGRAGDNRANFARCPASGSSTDRPRFLAR